VRTVFVDTVYWLATFRKDDPWRPSAVQASRALGAVRLVTVDEVLVEFLAAVAGGDSRIRAQAGPFVRAILAHPNVEVYPQSRDSFLEGLALYEARRDQRYSLTDCIAMNAMRAAGIRQVLTNDRHFEQEGFAILMKR